MNFEFLVEDQSSGKALEILIPKLLGNDVTARIHSYKGLGRIPQGLRPKSGASKRMLLDRLPQLLRGYGSAPDYGYIIIICDLDNKDKHQFLSELNNVLDTCEPKPKAYFCLAIEEFEAWYLGDLNAVRKAYPKAKDSVLSNYANDSICGTWEVLADAIYKGGHEALKRKGWQAVGTEKSAWAKTISPHMNINDNVSPSFNFLHSQLRNILENN